jgi:hypothetical protein
MMRIKFMLLIFFIAAVSLTFVAGFIAPHRTANLSLVESTLVPDKVALLEPLTLTLDSPSIIRLSDAAAIRLTVTIDAHGNVSVATDEAASAPVASVSDAFDSYNVIAEARLDLPRMYVQPAGLVSQPLVPGENVTFTWYIRADAVGEHEGMAWLFLRFVPKGDDVQLAGQVSDPGSELAVAAMPVQLRVVSFLGMKGSTARIIGTVGLFVGFLLALPLLLDRLYRPKKVIPLI